MNLIETAETYKNGAEIIASWLGTGGHTVSRDAAQVRADVCLKCPHNIDSVSIPSQFAKTLKIAVEIKNWQRLRVSGEKRLHICDACLCHLPTKVWVPIDHIAGHTRPEEMPRGCWVANELENL
jgi:hypothetical protein